VTNKRSPPTRWCMPLSQGFRGRPDGADLKRGGKILGRVRPYRNTGVGFIWYWTGEGPDGKTYNTLWKTQDIPEWFSSLEAAKESCLAYVKGI